MNEVMVDEKAHNSKESNKSHNLPDFDYLPFGPEAHVASHLHGEVFNLSNIRSAHTTTLGKSVTLALEHQLRHTLHQMLVSSL